MDISRFCCYTILAVATLALSVPVVIEGFHVVPVTYGHHAISVMMCSNVRIAFDPQYRESRFLAEVHRSCRWCCHDGSSRTMTMTMTMTTTTLSMIDPVTTWNTLGGMDAVVATLVGNGPEIGAAVVGAAAGAWSQVPKIQQLNEQVIELQLELELSQTKLTAKIQLLEDKLFEMDREFEDQTTRFKRQYDSTQRERLEQIKEKLKQEYQFKLDIQREERKSEDLMKQVDKEHNRTSQQQELSMLTLQKQRLEEANVKLEQALLQSEAEYNRMVESAAEKAAARKRFFFF